MKKIASILLAALLSGIVALAQDNPFLGTWKLQVNGLPYGDGKMTMVITPDGGYMDGDQKTHLEDTKVEGNTLKTAYTAMGYKVTFSLTLQEDGSVKGKMADMFEMTGTRVEGSAPAVAKESAPVTESKPVSLQDIQGEWYGLYSGSPLTVNFTENEIRIASEAFSSMNMDCTYSLKEGSPTGLSLSAGPTGMAGEGICAIEKGKLEVLLIFGAPGQVPAPNLSRTVLPTQPLPVSALPATRALSRRPPQK